MPEAKSGKAVKIAIVAVVAVAVVGVIVLKNQRMPQPVNEGTPKKAGQPESRSALPRLVDLGAGKCVPCKVMAPILEELKKTFSGRLQVDFIDVWQNPDASTQYGVQIIPTQIFYDSSGKELFRHEGFFSREDILGKWKEFGVDLGQ